MVMLPEDITASTWYFLISISINSLVLLIFCGIVLRQFIIKKTVGTLLLFISYLFILLAEIDNSLTIGTYIFTNINEKYLAVIQLVFPLLYGIGYVFLYFFANRHILQDSDVIKAITSILLSAIVSILTGLMIFDAIMNAPNTLLSNNPILQGPNILQYIPNQIIGLVMFLPIFIFIHIRIIIRLIKIRSTVDSKLAKVGFTYILLSMLFLILSTLTVSFYLYDYVVINPVFVNLAHGLRMIFVTVGSILGYFGWTLPDWLRRRIRGKAWIVKQITKEFKPSTKPILSSNEKDHNKTIAIELNEK